MALMCTINQQEAKCVFGVNYYSSSLLDIPRRKSLRCTAGSGLAIWAVQKKAFAGKDTYIIRALYPSHGHIRL